MTETNSIPPRRSRKPREPAKPKKPYPDFPLFPHATKRWAKKIRGRTHYFGSWEAGWQAALDKYISQKEDLYSGRTPRTEPDGLTIRELLNRFLTGKQNVVDTGKLTSRSFSDYKDACQRVAHAFGLDRLVCDLAADDFEGLRKTMAETWGPVRLGAEIQRTRTIFKYAFDAGLIDRQVRYGPGFAKPSRRTVRIARAEAGEKLFTAEEIRRLLEAASLPLRAMILLGCNGGFGNSDCGNLKLRDIDLVNGWHTFARPKTGTARRCPLWPETVSAIKAFMEKRPEPKDEGAAGLLFITKRGLKWAKDVQDNPISKEMKKLMCEIEINGRKGLGFYTLRHCTETIGSEAKDPVALDHIMGHARNDMASVYRERISDERLRAVAEYVRKWLFAKKRA